MRLFNRACNVIRRSASNLPIVISVLAFAFAQVCVAQSFTSSITGTVTDPTGAAVQGVALELKDMATDDVRNATSGSNGSYQFTNLSPGTYQITATAAGFKSFVQQNLILQANTGSARQHFARARKYPAESRSDRLCRPAGYRDCEYLGHSGQPS